MAAQPPPTHASAAVSFKLSAPKRLCAAPHTWTPSAADAAALATGCHHTGCHHAGCQQQSAAGASVAIAAASLAAAAKAERFRGRREGLALRVLLDNEGGFVRDLGCVCANGGLNTSLPELRAEIRGQLHQHLPPGFVFSRHGEGILPGSEAREALGDCMGVVLRAWPESAGEAQPLQPPPRFVGQQDPPPLSERPPPADGGSRAAEAAAAAPAESRAIELYIGNVAAAVDETRLLELLVQIGPVENLHMPKKPGTDEHRGYAFAAFAERSQAQYTADVLTGLPLGSSRLQARFSNNSG